MDGFDVAALEADPIERLADAAERLGMSERSLRNRRRVRRLSTGSGPGRPREGVVVGLLRSEWDYCAQRIAPGRKRPTGKSREPWSPREDGILRDRTTPPKRGRLIIDWPALLAALPRRGKAGIESRRAEIGLTRAPSWSDHELVTLRRKFGKVSRATMMAMLHTKSWASIIKQAKLEGLAGLPEGRMMLTAAAKEFGYHVATFRALLIRHRVKITKYTCCDGDPSAGQPMHHVSVAACHRAVKADMELETLIHASERTGIPRKTLWGWMIASGEATIGRRGRWQKFAPRVFDEVAAANGFKRGGETLQRAAKRSHVDPHNLRTWLKAAGVYQSVPRGQRLYLDPAIVDATVNKHRAKDVG
jgi:hypothetical protein